MSKKLNSGLEFLSPCELLHHNRIDVYAKLLFLKNLATYIMKICTNSKYFAVLRALLKSLITPKKITFEKFKQAFFEINQAISKSSFDWHKSPIIINKKNQLINGAHRLASSIHNNQCVGVVKVDGDAPKQDIEFFKKMA